MSEGEDIWMEIVRIHEADGAKPFHGKPQQSQIKLSAFAACHHSVTGID